jgi:hypothetical protein
MEEAASFDWLTPRFQQLQLRMIISLALAREKCRHQKFQQLQLTIISTFTVVNMQ